MKLAAIAVMVVGLASANTGTARAETAIGAVFGYPGNAGVSLRFDRTAIGVAWSSDFVHATGDLWLKKTAMKDGEGKLSWYYGPGIDAGFPSDDTHEFFFAARLPFGLQYMATPKLELFGELAPGLQLVDQTDFYWAAGFGIRLVLGQ